MMIAIVDYGLGNLFSISHAFKSLGVDTVITSNHKDIIDADGVILPGVGSYPTAIKNIIKLELNETLKYVNKSKTPLLGICLGYQLLFSSSTENEFTLGLNFFNGKVVSFKEVIPKSKIPNIGWLKLGKIKENSILLKGLSKDNYVYFVHSFFVKETTANTICYSDYDGVSFASVCEKDNILGTQFHPEKSGPIGLKIYQNFVDFVSKSKGKK